MPASAALLGAFVRPPFRPLTATAMALQFYNRGKGLWEEERQRLKLPALVATGRWALGPWTGVAARALLHCCIMAACAIALPAIGWINAMRKLESASEAC